METQQNQAEQFKDAEVLLGFGASVRNLGAMAIGEVLFDGDKLVVPTNPMTIAYWRYRTRSRTQGALGFGMEQLVRGVEVATGSHIDYLPTLSTHEVAVKSVYDRS